MTAAAALDPMRAAPGGHYDDGLVRVSPVRTARYGVWADRDRDGIVTVRHRLARLDDDLAEALAAALRPLTDDHELFTRAFTGVVLTSDPDPREAWRGFYRASLARLDDPAHPGYAAVYRHALDLLPRTSVLDLGASLGFLALHLARLGVAVTALEPDPGTAGLLALMAGDLGLSLDVRAEPAQALPDNATDAVAMLHVLEHVDAELGASLLAEALRLARRRVVVAVPYEDPPCGLYGHVRALQPPDLAQLGRDSGARWDVHEASGGWLVLDHP